MRPPLPDLACLAALSAALLGLPGCGGSAADKALGRSFRAVAMTVGKVPDEAFKLPEGLAEVASHAEFMDKWAAAGASGGGGDSDWD